ncbi:hypothetical protein WICMUC_002586 [Wickerhamomyces mucosus]|uniref:PPIase cyclophilin-type domain-containing protein n=1 Tax=Wickerhamomyces mucosus TaxID=1378264 RepID=A0A9P8PQH2_9ASCO|nr:hypothetical protein WICMUC_002586 [Wickerhamomyces mucosus]
MSLEPQTTAKVRLHTTKGPITIELWAKETPITSRIFLNNVLNQNFNNWEFNRVIPNFLIQVDNNQDQNNEYFQDEFNPRIKFNKRGLLGSVNNDKPNTNTNKFFITLNEAPELNRKNTIFGKIKDDSIFSVLQMSEGELNGETPLFPTKIIKSEVLIPYFDDLKLDNIKDISQIKTTDQKKKKKNNKVKLKLYENDEEEFDEEIEIKMKSMHEILNKNQTQNLEKRLEVNQSEVTTDITKDDQNYKDDNNHEEKESSESIVESKDADIASPNTITKVSPSNTTSIELTKDDREKETLRLLRSFERKIKRPHSSIKDNSNVRSTNSGPNDSAVDSDFDNLSESESDEDIYTHKLKFEFEELQDDLVTIDERKGEITDTESKVKRIKTDI